jgi:hypothetical protein
MSGWIEVDSQKINPPTQVNVNGVTFDVMMSPYDVPRQVRGNYDKDLEHFVIEFDYLDSEPLKERRVDRYVSLQVGKNSGRLYRIEVDTVALNAGQIQLRVSLSDLNLEPGRPEQKRNYDAVKQTLSTYDHELLNALSA